MHRKLAELLVREVSLISGKLNQSILEVARISDQNFVHQHTRLTGRVMGLLYLDILRGVFRQYPDLEPDSMKETKEIS
jgi:hypothetical protein